MKQDKVASCTGIALLSVVTILITTLLNGWTLSVIWNWFMPTLFRLATLTLWQAIGVSMVFALFTGTNNVKKETGDSKYDTFTEALIGIIIEKMVVAGATVFMAWVVYQLAF